MKLPTLYKKTSTGAIQQWSVEVEGSTIIATYGQQGGKLQVARDTIAEGKNIGKSNETSAERQAELEARAQWQKKMKKGYVQDVALASAGGVDEEFISGGVSPMLAQSFAKHGHKIVFPAFAQPKLDGHRCIAMRVDGTWTLWSRTRKPITGVPHIIAALDASGVNADITLDGELYNHDYRDRFEELTSFIKRPEPKPGHEVVQYHVYDAVIAAPFHQRLVIPADVAARADSDAIVAVETKLVADEDEAMEAFGDFIEQGYEGAMLRNSKSPYVEKRSYDLQKMKEFDDAEFEIVGVEEGRGKMAGKGIFVCRTEAGDEFRTKQKGSLDDLAIYLQDPGRWIGKMLTVQFQGYTNDSNVPRFPIGLRVREDV